MNPFHFLRARRGVARAALVAAGLASAACDGGNAFQGTPVGPGGGGGGKTAADATRPTVSLVFPKDSAIVAVGDSIFVQATVSDNVKLGKLTLEGYSVRGDRALGTDVRVDRFSTKFVDLSAIAKRDTTITRYLNATGDSIAERRVIIIATLTDSTGNSSADTAFVNLGGPRVEIASPTAGTSFGAGSQIPVRLVAVDPNDLIRAVTLRGTGAFAYQNTITLATPRARLDTTVVVPIPANVTGSQQFEATATSGSNLQATARPVTVTITPAARDTSPPRVTFNTQSRDRAQTGDTLVVNVSAVDEGVVTTVGASLRVRYRNPTTGAAEDRFLTAELAASSGSVRFPLALLGLAQTDTTTLSVEVTAFAVDNAANCGAATTPNIPQSVRCVVTSGVRTAGSIPGQLITVLVTRGFTVPLSDASDRIADIVSDGTRLFASNFSRNRVEVLPLRANAFATPVGVGSQPWGLAIGNSGDTLLVANSGGTNVSVVSLQGTAVEARRIRTPDAQLFDVRYDVRTDTAASVTAVDFSDRPQFVGQVRSGQVLYSTKPTTTRPDGTIRIYDARKDTLNALNRGPEVFISYAERLGGRAIAVNALTAGVLPFGRLRVCPRRVSSSGADPACIDDLVSVVAQRLTVLRAAGQTDTRLDLGADIESIGLSDTTFVGTSTDRSAIAFGEGARGPGRIFYFRSLLDGRLQGSTVETQDLVGNAAERVIGLSLNGDGSLGVARGAQVYFFDDGLRLQGVVASGSPTGGSSMHPQNVGYPNNDGRRLGFVSGVTANGTPYIDVIDTFSFRSLRRLILRDVVSGTMVAVPVVAGDPDAGTFVLRLFAITPTGLIRIGLTAADVAL